MERPEIKGCPWCGSQPHHEVTKYHNCGEPYFVVKLCCKNCGVSVARTAREAEYDQASDINRALYANKELPIPFADAVAHVVLKGRLIPFWNTRA